MSEVCVVGAGPAGLAMGRALLQQGVPFHMFDRNPGVGGIWNPAHAASPMYLSAHFISSKGAPATTFRGFPFPDAAATYPAHHEVLAYLQDFADRSGVLPHTTFSLGVTCARLIDGAWNVRFTDGSMRKFSALICASGTLCDPILPDIPGSFTGTVRHSVSYRSSSEVAGKSVLVVGAGNSGVDIACDVARSARRVMLSMRRGYWVVPKFIRGKPTDVALRSRDALPDWVHPPDAAALLELLLGNPSAYGLPEPDHAPFTSHPIMNSDLLNHIGHGRILPRRSIADTIGSEVIFDDGARDEVDEIILATGYRASVPYLEDDVLDYGDGNRPQLWLRLFHRSIPSLYCLGFIETNSGVFRLFDLGAELIAKRIRKLRNGIPGGDGPGNETGREPDLTGGVERIATPRHLGYVDSRTYERVLMEAIERDFGHAAAS